MIQYIGIPYEEMDCWDLVAYLYSNEFDIDLGDREAQAQGIQHGEWIEIDIGEERKHDVLVFSDSSLHKHVGICLDHGKFLHSIAGLNSCIDSYKRTMWSGRLRKVYRHKALL